MAAGRGSPQKNVEEKKEAKDQKGSLEVPAGTQLQLYSPAILRVAPKNTFLFAGIPNLPEGKSEHIWKRVSVKASKLETNIYYIHSEYKEGHEYHSKIEKIKISKGTMIILSNVVKEKSALRNKIYVDMQFFDPENNFSRVFKVKVTNAHVAKKLLSYEAALIKKKTDLTELRVVGLDENGKITTLESDKRFLSVIEKWVSEYGRKYIYSHPIVSDPELKDNISILHIFERPTLVLATPFLATESFLLKQKMLPRMSEVLIFDIVPKNIDDIGPNDYKEAPILMHGYMFTDDLKDFQKLIKFEENIFKTPPRSKDIIQGSIGNCFMLAAADSILSQKKAGEEFIQGMMQQQEDRTIVRFFEPSTHKPIYICVPNVVIYKGDNPISSHEAKWVHILEHAYTVFLFLYDFKKGFFPSILSINQGGEAGEVLKVFTGQRGEIVREIMDSYVSISEEIPMIGVAKESSIKIVENLLEKNSIFCSLLNNDKGLLLEWVNYLKTVTDIPVYVKVLLVFIPFFEENISQDNLIKNLASIDPQPPEDVIEAFKQKLIAGEKDKTDSGCLILKPQPLGSCQYTITQHALYDELKQLYTSGHSLVAVTPTHFPEKEDATGLVPKHAYAIVGFNSINIKSGNLLTVTLRNPWNRLGRKLIVSKSGEIQIAEAKDPIFNLDLSDFTKFYTTYSVNKIPNKELLLSLCAEEKVEKKEQKEEKKREKETVIDKDLLSEEKIEFKKVKVDGSDSHFGFITLGIKREDLVNTLLVYTIQNTKAQDELAWEIDNALSRKELVANFLETKEEDYFTLSQIQDLKQHILKVKSELDGEKLLVGTMLQSKGIDWKKNSGATDVTAIQNLIALLNQHQPENYQVYVAQLKDQSERLIKLEQLYVAMLHTSKVCNAYIRAYSIDKVGHSFALGYHAVKLYGQAKAAPWKVACESFPSSTSSGQDFHVTYTDNFTSYNILMPFKRSLEKPLEPDKGGEKNLDKDRKKDGDKGQEKDQKEEKEPGIYKGMLREVEVEFREVKVDGSENDCGFITLGIKRDDLVNTLLAYAENTEARDELALEIDNALVAEELNADFLEIKEDDYTVLLQIQKLKKNILEVKNQLDQEKRLVEEILQSKGVDWKKDSGAADVIAIQNLVALLNQHQPENYQVHAEQLKEQLGKVIKLEQSYNKKLRSAEVYKAYARAYKGDRVGYSLALGYHAINLYGRYNPGNSIKIHIWKKTAPGKVVCESPTPATSSGQDFHMLHTDRFTHYNILMLFNRSPEKLLETGKSSEKGDGDRDRKIVIEQRAQQGNIFRGQATSDSSGKINPEQILSSMEKFYDEIKKFNMRPRILLELIINWMKACVELQKVEDKKLHRGLLRVLITPPQSPASVLLNKILKQFENLRDKGEAIVLHDINNIFYQLTELGEYTSHIKTQIANLARLLQTKIQDEAKISADTTKTVPSREAKFSTPEAELEWLFKIVDENKYSDAASDLLAAIFHWLEYVITFVSLKANNPDNKDIAAFKNSINIAHRELKQMTLSDTEEVLHQVKTKLTEFKENSDCPPLLKNQMDMIVLMLTQRLSVSASQAPRGMKN